MSGACPGPGSGAGGWRGDRSGPALTQPRELDAVSVGEARALRDFTVVEVAVFIFRFNILN
ncbi:hypothetical protein JEQ12_018220, partial [Ovis aries]